MEIYEALDYYSQVIVVAANGAVAMACFPAFRVLRWTPILLLGISALLGVFCGFVDAILMPRITDDSSYASVWIGNTVLLALDLILYAVGIWFLLRKVLQITGKTSDQAESVPITDQEGLG